MNSNHQTPLTEFAKAVNIPRNSGGLISKILGKDCITNVDEFNAIVKEIDDSLAKLKVFTIKFKGGEEIPVVESNQYLSVQIIDEK